MQISSYARRLSACAAAGILGAAAILTFSVDNRQQGPSLDLVSTTNLIAGEMTTTGTVGIAQVAHTAGSRHYVPFTPAADGFLSTVSVDYKATSAGGGSGTASNSGFMRVDLLTNAGSGTSSKPHALIASLGYFNFVQANGDLTYTITIPGGVGLTSGTRYWLEFQRSNTANKYFMASYTDMTQSSPLPTGGDNFLSAGAGTGLGWVGDGTGTGASAFVPEQYFADASSGPETRTLLANRFIPVVTLGIEDVPTVTVTVDPTCVLIKTTTGDLNDGVVSKPTSC